MVEKIGNTGIRPQDFYGHCPQCHRDCRDDVSKFFLGNGEHGGKFSLGFEVEDKFKNFDPNASGYEKFLTKDYPNGSVQRGRHRRRVYACNSSKMHKDGRYPHRI